MPRCIQKIAGRKRPALVDPSHKVHQGGKGSVWDGQTYGRTDGHFHSTSGHFQSTSGSLPVHLGTIGGHMKHHSYSLPKKMTFTKITHKRTNGKRVTSKDPFRIYARDLKKYSVDFMKVLGQRGGGQKHT